MHPKSLIVGARVKWRKAIPHRGLVGEFEWHIGIVKSFSVEDDRIVISLPSMAPNTYSKTYLSLSEIELKLQ